MCSSNTGNAVILNCKWQQFKGSHPFISLFLFHIKWCKEQALKWLPRMLPGLMGYYMPSYSTCNSTPPAPISMLYQFFLHNIFHIWAYFLLLLVMTFMPVVWPSCLGCWVRGCLSHHHPSCLQLCSACRMPVCTLVTDVYAQITVQHIGPWPQTCLHWQLKKPSPTAYTWHSVFLSSLSCVNPYTDN